MLAGFAPIPPRHTMLVSVPVPTWGSVTVVVMDDQGNLSIKVDQSKPEDWGK